MSEPEASDPTDPTEEAPGDGLSCDFCGEPSSSVRRVALDRDYDRLRTRHKVLYACASCSERKERQRMGLERG